MKVIQQFDVDIVSASCIFIKNEIPTQVFSYGFLRNF